MRTQNINLITIFHPLTLMNNAECQTASMCYVKNTAISEMRVICDLILCVLLKLGSRKRK